MSAHKHEENTLYYCEMFESCLKMPCKLILPLVARIFIPHYTPLRFPSTSYALFPSSASPAVRHLL